jgi:hypothetical protein
VVRIRSVEALNGLRVRLVFTDGFIGEVDLGPFLRGPIFEPLLSDRALFASVRVDPECETIGWPNGADIDPDTLYAAARGQSSATESPLPNIPHR